MPDESAGLHDRFNSRRLAALWSIAAEIRAEAPIHLGGGAAGLADMTILREAGSGKPLLTGSTLAGALRAQLAVAGVAPVEIERLMGGGRGDSGGPPSPLFAFDAVAKGDLGAEIRDSVCLDPATAVAKTGAKFDLEMLPCGAVFPLRLELEITQNDAPREGRLLDLLAVALGGLDLGAIRLGARRTRGFGRCSTHSWMAARWDLADPAGWNSLLRQDPLEPVPKGAGEWPTLAAALAAQGYKGSTDPIAATPGWAMIELNLVAEGGVLVRAAAVGVSEKADAVQLTSAGQHVVPATSLAGVLRARARRIAGVVRAEQGDAAAWVVHLFGPPPEQRANHARSRLRVSEALLGGAKPLANHRVRIDSFSGGAVDAALFDEAPVYGSRLTAELEYAPLPGDGARPGGSGEAALGLLLLTLKDLASADLAVGGTGSVGRGFFRGTVTMRRAGSAPQCLKPSEGAASEIRALIDAFRCAPRLEVPA